MTDSTTHQRTRRHRVAITIATAALATTLTGAHPADATDEPSEEPTPTPTGHAQQLIAPDARPIIVADAYHGIGVIVCAENKRPVTVADAYHGIGVTVCV